MALTDDRDEVPAGNEKEALYFLTFSTSADLVIVKVLGFHPSFAPKPMKVCSHIIGIAGIIAFCSKAFETV